MSEETQLPQLSISYLTEKGIIPGNYDEIPDNTHCAVIQQTIPVVEPNGKVNPICITYSFWMGREYNNLNMALDALGEENKAAIFSCTAKGARRIVVPYINGEPQKGPKPIIFPLYKNDKNFTDKEEFAKAVKAVGEAFDRIWTTGSIHKSH